MLWCYFLPENAALTKFIGVGKYQVGSVSKNFGRSLGANQKGFQRRLDKVGPIQEAIRISLAIRRYAHVDSLLFIMLNKDMALTEKDLDEIEVRLSRIFATKKDIVEYKSSLMDKLDKILKEILKSREEETVLAHQVSNHENRITGLEAKISPA